MSEVMDSNKFTYPPPFTYPAVSVIIPLYNAEKYLGECLDSILNQTFQNFEVIIVDDCSTDSSCAIVESYIPKFGGRLTLSHMEENSGSGALPRNKGLTLSRGEYIFFMDVDDMFTKTALEELYSLAKNYNADVVYTEKYYEIDVNGKNIRLTSHQNGMFTDKATLESEDLTERFQALMRDRYWVTPWCKLARRNLIIENEINFPHCKISEDDVWTYGLVFYAKKFLRVPNVVYTYRVHEESVGQKRKTPEQNIDFWLNPIFFGLKKLDYFMSKLDFFQKNPQYRYAILESFIINKTFAPYKDTWQMPPFAIYEIIKQNFGKNVGEQDVLVSALCTYAITLQKINALNTQKFNQFTAQAQARIKELETEIDKLKSKE